MKGKEIKKDNQYYQGTLQLRNSFPDANEYVFSHVEKEPDVFIAKTVERGRDIDFYLSSNKFLLVLARKMHAHFGGLMKVSRTLFSQNKQTSKLLWRVTVLLRFFEFQKEDILLFTFPERRRIVRIRRITGTKLYCVDLQSGKQFSFNYHKEPFEILDVKFTRVTKVYPRLEVMNPLSFQSEPVENPVRVKLGQNVEVVVVDNRIWLT